MNLNELTVNDSYKLIITIVKKGTASKVVGATKKAGAKGGTILLGRGTAAKNVYLEILGINYDVEKEVILTFVKHEMAEEILQVIVAEAQLNKPGKGISFIVNISKLAGIFHLLKTH
ncbi:nitrogen regulatory protein P-II family [Anaerobacterium chartisolvens]|uniref:Nitrogen regulatory protein P-II family n=1 Tax=Anaerobacterium chartisolvens TaxID=1297424 RepID=A0A369AP60_9FIRM|nr:P-II family nitrogen regulator [Anaerobacterium chartisolvens]RCX09987.1 nitrogen regulatory protein P-II family [Anaerobacterium chartisolvens]